MKNYMRYIYSLWAGLLVTMGLLPGLAAPVNASSQNLITNPSMETSVSGKPSDWSSDKWGNNTATFAYLNTGHTGNHSVQTKMTKHKSGDAKWYFSNITVKPNTSYTYSDWYESNVMSGLDVMVTTTTGAQQDMWLVNPAKAASWKQISHTFTTPANAASLTVYHSINRVGQITLDDASLVDNSTTVTPTAPTVSITSPTDSANVSGTVSVTANASDEQKVTRVQFKLDGADLGAAVTASPYSTTWDTTKVANGTHTLTAVATNSSNLSTTSSTVTVTVDNQVTPSAPTVSVTAPANNATVTGTVTVTAAASDTTGIANVQFKLDGADLGSADTTNPYSVSWDTTTATNGTHTLTAVATNTGNLSTTSSIVTVNVQNKTTPTISLTAPAANATVSGTTTVTATASDSTPLAGVQFKLDGADLGAQDTTAPYSVAWDTKTATNGTHTLTAIATNTLGGSATSSSVSVTVNNPTAPTVSVTAPAANATVSGSSVSLSANASDAQAVASVQFKLDGANVGSADTTAPYSVTWDSTKVANGAHVVTAIATNSAGLTTTSATVSFTVNNTVVTPPAANLIANPSFETASGTAPADWIADSWGSNTSKFTYLNTGHTGNHSVEVQTTKYTNGAANWYYNEVPVTGGKSYLYSNWYESNVDTEVDAEVTMSDGTVQYYYLGTVFASTNWMQFKTTFTPPAGAKSMSIYQILGKVGYIISDDYSLSEYTPAQYNRPIVSVTFDDGWQNQYQNAFPVLQQDGINGTFYIISGELNDTPDYMTSTQVKNLYAAGNEIGSHSVTHPDFTTLTATQVHNQFANSQTTLQNLIGAPVTDFAYPYGAYNLSTIAEGEKYYASQRSVNGGENTKDNLDVTQLKIEEVDSDISQAQVKAWIDQAIADHAWLVLVYHEVATTPSAADDALYTTQPADFTAEMDYLKSTGVTTMTMHQALTEVQSQQ